jgi:hypothetical protein
MRRVLLAFCFVMKIFASDLAIDGVNAYLEEK